MINDTILLGMFGGNEVIIILAVVLLLFGGKKIPELMRGLGKGMKEFKNATNDIKEEINEIDPTKELRK
jgi:sec-independent protein translocase protein TatA